MSQKILAILCSPRKNGNSTLLARRAMEGVAAAGGVCETFYVNDMNIRPCQACDGCRQPAATRCVQEDDMHLIYGALKAADALLLAAPIYMFTMPAQLKLFLDRCYAVFGALAGKRVGVIFTYGGEDERDSGAINAINAMQDLFDYAKASIACIVHAIAADEGEIATNTRVMDEAFELGKKLAE